MNFDLEPPDQETAAMLSSIESSPAMRPADERYVRFYTRSRENKVKSWGGKMTVNGKEVEVEAAGRPIFEPVEYVEILTVGDKDNIVDRPVRILDKYVWANRYKAFRNGQAQDADGTLLSAWGGMSQERVQELAHFRLKTVEQLADVPDNTLQSLGLGARAEREKAKSWLAVMKGSAPVAELRAELEAERSERAALQARLAALELLAASGGARPGDLQPKRGRGRPRKTGAAQTTETETA